MYVCVVSNHIHVMLLVFPWCMSVIKQPQCISAHMHTRLVLSSHAHSVKTIAENTMVLLSFQPFYVVMI